MTTGAMGYLGYRDANEDDLGFIREIEKNYALYTHASLMTQVAPLAQMRLSFRYLRSTGMPYRVAVDSAVVRPGVVGFAYLLPSNDTFWPTGELRMWVHPLHCGRGVGTQLVEQLKELVSRALVVMPRVPCRLPGPGPGPVLRNMLVAQVLDPFGREGGRAASRFFRDRGFRECGRLQSVAWKNGQWLDVVYWQFSTVGRIGMADGSFQPLE